MISEVTRLKIDAFMRKALEDIRLNAINIDTGQYFPKRLREELAAELSYEVTEDEFILRGKGYFYTLVTGRGPTVNPGPGAVRRYITEYLEEQGESGADLTRHAFNAATRQHEYGSKLYRSGQQSEVVKSIINEQTIADLKQQVAQALVIDVGKYIQESV